MRCTFRIALVVWLIALIAAACGGDDGAGASTTSTVAATTTSRTTTSTTKAPVTTTTQPDEAPVTAADLEGTWFVAAGPVTIENEVDFTSRPDTGVIGTFEVTESADVLGCTSGAFRGQRFAHRRHSKRSIPVTPGQMKVPSPPDSPSRPGTLTPTATTAHGPLWKAPTISSASKAA
jgi:hypothetical protein